jgi:putative copper resistance protein D
VATFVVATAAPAWAHSHGAPIPSHPGLVVEYGQMTAAVLVAATVVLVGLVVAPLVAGPPVRPARRWVVLAIAGLSGVAADVATLAWPALARLTFGGWPTRVALAHLLLATVILLRVRRTRPLAMAAVGAALLLVLALSEDSDGTLHTVVATAHLFAATVWAGGILHLALGWSGRSEHRAGVRGAARRFGPTAAVAAVLTVSSAVAATHLHVPRSSDLIGTGYGQLVMVEIVFASIVLVVAAALHRGAEPREGRRLSLVRVEAGLVTLAVGVGAALSVLSPPEPFVQLAEDRSAVTTAACASRHLGHLAGLQAADTESPARYRLAPVDPQGRTAASTCGLARGSTPDPDPSAVGSAYGSFLDSWAVHRTTVFSDDTPGSQVLTASLVASARSTGSAVSVAHDWEPGQRYAGGGDAVVIATSPERATSIVSAVAASSSRPVRGIFLVPWLLEPGLFAPALSTTGVQVTIGLDHDPNSNLAASYIDDLSRVDRRAIPSGAGLEGYLEAFAAAERTSVPKATALRFYTASQAQFLPASLSEGHAEQSPAEWFPQASFMPVSGLVALPGAEVAR